MSFRLAVGNKEGIGRLGGTSEKEHPTPYRMTEKDVENTSGSVVHIIILKPVFAKTVLLILEVQECFAPGAKVQDREKHRVASVKPVNFIGSSGLKESTSVCMPKNLSLKEKKKNPIFL